jgi:hypothetical protein
VVPLFFILFAIVNLQAIGIVSGREIHFAQHIYADNIINDSFLKKIGK